MNRRKLYVTTEEIDRCNRIAKSFGDEAAANEYRAIQSFKQQDKEVMSGN